MQGSFLSVVCINSRYTMQRNVKIIVISGVIALSVQNLESLRSTGMEWDGLFSFLPVLSMIPIDNTDIPSSQEPTSPRKESKRLSPVEHCITPECIRQVALSMSKAWPRKSWETWCQPKTNETTVDGLVLIKVPKSASSTVTGAAMRIANRKNCKIRWQHRRLDEYGDLGRGSSQRFLMAPIRRADSRALSSFYFHHVSFHSQSSHRIPRDRFVVTQLGKVQSNYILNYTAPLPFLNASESMLKHSVEEVLKEYNFLIVVERMVESLVVLSWITGLDIEDFLTMSSKQSGSYYHTGKRCITLKKAVQTNATYDLFDSDKWRLQHYGDYLLYAVADASLNATIELMGQVLFESKTRKLRQLQDRIEVSCSSETLFPCSSNGTLQLKASRASCYHRDFGCGHQCIDRITSS